MTRIVFFGTPDFAVPTLRYLTADRQFEIALVVSQPDRPAGRGRRLESPPVVVAARELNLPVYQTATLRQAAAREPLVAAAADLFVVAAFGLIFGPQTLALPRLGCVNVHASLLPSYRGAAPISAAILNGDEATGVTLMQMEPGLDTGPMLARSTEPITAADTTATLTERLALTGARLAAAQLAAYVGGELQPVPQPATGASLTRPLRKADGRLDWGMPAAQLEREVRAFWPWPRAWTEFGGSTLQVHEATVIPDLAITPGTVLLDSGALIVACGAGGLELHRIQLAGGRPMLVTDWLAGRPLVPDQLPVGVRGEERPPLIVPV